METINISFSLIRKEADYLFDICHWNTSTGRLIPSPYPMVWAKIANAIERGKKERRAAKGKVASIKLELEDENGKQD